MVKQYVGARYVPKFASPLEWAANTSYEALTVVTFNNASYTSKVPVPPTVGNPANNPQYWALSGNYNAQVEQYRQETENYKTEVEGYRQDTENYNAQVEQYRQDAEKNLKKLRTCINVRENGLDNTGNTDNSEKFNSLIAANKNGTFYFEDGVYSFNSPIVITGNCEIILSHDATIKASDEMDYLINLPYEKTPSVFGYGRFNIKGGTIDCNNKAKIALNYGYIYMCEIHDIVIKNFTEYGVHQLHGGGLQTINTLIAGGNGAEIGYFNESADSKLINVTVMDCKTGFNSLNDIYVNCTAWLSNSSIYPDSVCFLDRSHSTYMACVADTYQIGWKLLPNAHSMLEGCSAIHNEGVIQPNATIFSGTSGAVFANNFIIMTSASGYTFSEGVDVNPINISGNLNQSVPDLRSAKQLLYPFRYRENVDNSNIDNVVNVFTNAYVQNVHNLENGWATILSAKDYFIGSQLAINKNGIAYRMYDNNKWDEFKKLLNISQSPVDITTTEQLDNMKSGATNAYFVGVSGFTNGWYTIITYKTSNFTSQITIGTTIKHRTYTDRWSEWV